MAHAYVWLVVLKQDAGGVACIIIVLVMPHGPQKSSEANAAKDQRDRDQDHEHIHLAYLMRCEFSKTVMDEIDIASAAASGVA